MKINIEKYGGVIQFIFGKHLILQLPMNIYEHKKDECGLISAIGRIEREMIFRKNKNGDYEFIGSIWINQIGHKKKKFVLINLI